MTGNIDTAIEALDRRFLLDHPIDAVRLIESLDGLDAAEILENQAVDTLLPVWRRMLPGDGAEILNALPDAQSDALIAELLPHEALRFLNLMKEDERENILLRLDPKISEEICKLMSYPETSTGRMLNPKVMPFRASVTVEDALSTLRAKKATQIRGLFLIDDENKLISRIFIQDMALAAGDTHLGDLARPVTEYVNALAPAEEVADMLDKDSRADLSVVDIEGKLIGVISYAAMVHSVQEDAMADMQTMVGASKDERALSSPFFAVKKRLPWLQINLLTAFMAAAVVGLFEGTIAKFTALAVLLPVVAGQSGYVGAQALAVTMRGLALREISIRQWARVTAKEVNVGLMNGIAVAITCGFGVYVWSGSVGLVIVIAISMVLAMVAAGFAGAVVPILLTRLSQYPAQSSSIVLTTVTDIAGFFSFLGIATLLSSMLKGLVGLICHACVGKCCHAGVTVSGRTDEVYRECGARRFAQAHPQIKQRGFPKLY